jgi:oligopeptide/dipeptide ABC transporter ATP-binding protein
MSEILLKVQNLHTSFFSGAGEIRAVNGLSFCLEEGKTLGLVGESGCGKTVTALSIMQLLPASGRITSGEMLYKGQNLLEYSASQMRQIRGKEISMIFQEPMTALNPVFTIGEQISEAIELHQGLKKKPAEESGVKLLTHVGIAYAQKCMKAYPHQLSGGMRQRVLIAMALSCSPELLIADEPTTALDVTIQAQILELLNYLKQENKLTMILITHDLGVIAENTDFAAIMYAGSIVEYAATKDLFNEPLHPYTKALFYAAAILGGNPQRPVAVEKAEGVSSVSKLPKGCLFHERCPEKIFHCEQVTPELVEVSKGHRVACCLYGKG